MARSLRDGTNSAILSAGSEASVPGFGGTDIPARRYVDDPKGLTTAGEAQRYQEQYRTVVDPRRKVVDPATIDLSSASAIEGDPDRYLGAGAGIGGEANTCSPLPPGGDGATTYLESCNSGSQPFDAPRTCNAALSVQTEGRRSWEYACETDEFAERTDMCPMLANAQGSGSCTLERSVRIYGARLWDRTRDFQIRDPRISANLGEYFKQCLFYDILLGHTSFDTIANSNNILADMGPGSPARGMKFLPASGPPIIVTCQNAYNELQTGITAYTELGLQQEGRKLFPGLTPALARAKLVSDLPVIANQFHGSSQTAQQVFQQRSLVNAFLEARANLGAADGDTFAMLRAEEQARNTYSSIAQQAMTWVPLLNIVLTVVFYAMFPVIFPLFLMPRTGTMALKGLLHRVLLPRCVGAALCGPAHVYHGPRFRCPEWDNDKDHDRWCERL